MNASRVDSGAAEYRTMQKIVTNTLRSAILNSRYKVGDRLQQDDLARELQVSRMPIREALRTLQAEGLVELRPHRGAVVVSLGVDDVIEIFEIRLMLESKAARLAAPLISDATLARLRQLYDESARHGDDVERWLELNREFHRLLCPTSTRPRLCALVEQYRNMTEPILRVAFSETWNPDREISQHAALVEAAERRDGEALAQATVAHLKSTEESLLGYLRRRADRRDGVDE